MISDPERPSVGCPMHDPEGPASGETPAQAPSPVVDPAVAAGASPEPLGLEPGPEPPGPEPPLFGWRQSMLAFFRDPIQLMGDLRQRYGDVVKLTSGRNQPMIFVPRDEPAATVFVFGADNNRRVLTDSTAFVGGKVRAPAKIRWLAEGSNQVEQQSHRSIAAERLSKHRLGGYQAEIVRRTRDRIEQWVPGSTMRLDQEIESLTADIASSVFFGQQPESDQHTFAEAARDMAHILFSPWSMIPINVPGTPYHRLIRQSVHVKTRLFEELDRKRAQGGTQEDLLATIAGLSDSSFEMDSNTLTFFAFTLFLAGHDVPASAVTFSLLLLAQHPAILRRLQLELSEHVGGRAPNMADLGNLPLLDSVYRESLRVMGPALLILRQAAETTEIGGYRIVAGSEVVVSPHMTHTDPRIFPRPRRFDPDRWTSLKPSPFEFLPYSQGHHKCLGAVFAEMEVKTILAMIVQSRVIRPVSGARLDLGYTITIRPKFRDRFEVLDLSQVPAAPVPIRGAVTRLVDFG